MKRGMEEKRPVRLHSRCVCVYTSRPRSAGASKVPQTHPRRNKAIEISRRASSDISSPQRTTLLGGGDFVSGRGVECLAAVGERLINEFKVV